MDKKQYTILEHYVPQCYLRQFSHQDGENHFAYCLFSNTTNIKRINVKNICAVKDLYELESWNGYVDRNLIEDGFIKIESNYANFCRNYLIDIDHCEEVKVESIDVMFIANFCAFLVFRNKEMVDALIKCCEDYVQYNSADWSALRREITSVDTQTLEQEIFPCLNQNLAYSLAHGLMKQMLDARVLSAEVVAFCEMLGSNCCFLYSQNEDFITSDFPLVNIYGRKAKLLGFEDIICLPINNKCCIAFSDNERHKFKVYTLNAEQVDIVNYAQFSKKYNLIISRDPESTLRYVQTKPLTRY